MYAKMTFAISMLAFLAGPFWDASATVRAGDPKQLVQDYLDQLGAYGYTLTAIDDDYVTDTFPDVAFFAVIFRQYPIAVLPPDDLASSNVFFVQDDQVSFLTSPDDLECLFFNELGPVQDDAAALEVGKTWLRLSEEFSQDGFFQFSPPTVTIKDNVVSGEVDVSSGGRGQIDVTISFDDDGNLTDIEESRDVVRGRRPY